MECLPRLPSVANIDVTVNFAHSRATDTPHPPQRDDTFTSVHSNLFLNTQLRAVKCFTNFQPVQQYLEDKQRLSCWYGYGVQILPATILKGIFIVIRGDSPDILEFAPNKLRCTQWHCSARSQSIKISKSNNACYRTNRYFNTSTTTSVFGDVVLLHSTGSVHAVRVGSSFCSIDMSTRKTLQTICIPEAFISECSLINDDVGIVTYTAVCHWPVQGGNPTLVFERQLELSYYQDYQLWIW